MGSLEKKQHHSHQGNHAETDGHLLLLTFRGFHFQQTGCLGIGVFEVKKSFVPDGEVGVKGKPLSAWTAMS